MNREIETKSRGGNSLPWVDDLFQQLRSVAGSDPSLARLIVNEESPGLHLAVFVEPFLRYILDGKKTVESRFSVHRHPPFEQVHPGDLLLLKKSSGPVCAVCRVSNVWYYRLDPASWAEIEALSTALCMDDSPFWRAKRNCASFATLMQLGDVTPLPDLFLRKTDARGWVVIKSRHNPERLRFA